MAKSDTDYSDGAYFWDGTDFADENSDAYKARYPVDSSVQKK